MSRGLRPILLHGQRRGLPSRAGFSRRDVLKMGVAATAIAGISSFGSIAGCNSMPPSDVSTQDRKLRAVVIGAGFAGLACADTLARNGADVTVLEATARPGGRVLTDRRFLSGRSVECGGEFVGINHPTWVRYARRFNIPLEPAQDFDGDTAIILEGRLLRGQEADALYLQIDSVLANLIQLARVIDPTRPWQSPDANQLDRMSLAAYLRATEMQPSARRLLHTIAEADNGVPPERMSLLAYLAMIAGGGFNEYFELSETHRAMGGNDSLATALANSLGDRVCFNSPVVSVQRLGSHAVVQTGRGAPIECDAVVLAVPPTVWHRIAVQTPLGDTRPQMGRNIKLITKIQRPAWEDRSLSPNLVSDGIVQLTWVSGHSASGKEKALTLFSGGRFADKLRQMDPRTREQGAVESLRPAYPTLSGAVTDSRFIDWPGMVHAMGSYSFPAPGEVGRFGPVLVDGFDDGLAPLRFAGEHTSYPFIGYMEGALSSGVRVGQELVRRSPSVLERAVARV